MNQDLESIRIPRPNRAALQEKIAFLKNENAFLREALEHFLFCRSCEVDEDFKYCELGKQYADQLGIITFTDTKAV